MHSTTETTPPVHPPVTPEATIERTHESQETKLVWRQPQIGQPMHLSRLTGQKGSSSEYDSYSDNRP